MSKQIRIFRSVLCLMLAVICIGICSGCGQKAIVHNLEPLKVTIFRVGKADAIVLETGEHTMVIDAGEEEDGEEVLAYLENQHISKLDTLLITHYDQDHVGGADTLVEALEIDQVVVPAYQGNNTEYVDFIHAVDERKLKLIPLQKTKEFSLGEAEVIVNPPNSYKTEGDSVEMDNNFSLITTVKHGEKRFLFTGDAEKQRIREWLSDGTAEKYDFLKVPHHGVYNTAMKELLEVTEPEYAVICSSHKNPADVETLELLKQFQTQIYQTKDGNVTVLSDGTHVEVHQELED